MKKEAFNIKGYVVSRVTPLIDSYVDWYAQRGIFLPPDYATDPTGWTEVLRKIQRAFILADTEDDDDGEIHQAKVKWSTFGQEDPEAIKELYNEIQLGFELFGKYLMHLKDIQPEATF